MDALKYTIPDFIRDEKSVFTIPPFQRNYSWGEEQCRELFLDLVDCYREGKKHYLGNIIYYASKAISGYTEFVLVDGQQRITTVLILLCALRDEIDDENKKSEIDKYLINEKRTDYRIRLKQTAYDSKSFELMISGGNLEQVDNNIAINYKLFNELIEESKIEPNDLYETMKNLEIVGVNLGERDSQEQVQKIFEKINSTGKPLTPADLIRNLLLLTHEVERQERLYLNYWKPMEDSLKNENISDFARDILIITTLKDVREKEIYREFKGLYRKDSEKEAILKEMLDYSKYYRWILFENSCPDEQIKRSIKFLNAISTEDVYPLYLYLLHEMHGKQTEELRRVFQLLLDFLLRFRIVMPSRGGGALSSVAIELIKKLRNGAVNLTYEDIRYELSNSASETGRYP